MAFSEQATESVNTLKIHSEMEYGGLFGGLSTFVKLQLIEIIDVAVSVRLTVGKL
jgi:hypothetical protein